jgi:DNA-binding NarL/FixJ family response regulator
MNNVNKVLIDTNNITQRHICFALTNPSVINFFEHTRTSFLMNTSCFFVRSIDEFVNHLSHHTPDCLVIEQLFDGIDPFAILLGYAHLVPSQVVIYASCPKLSYDERLFQLPVTAVIDYSSTLTHIVSILLASNHAFHQYPLHLQKAHLQAKRRINAIPAFSEKELQLIQLICEEKAIHEISLALQTSIPIIKKSRSILYKKIGVQSAVGLAMFAVRHSLVK